MNNGIPLYAGSINSNQNYNTSYLNNLLKINKGKKVKIYISNSSEYKEFDGIIENSGINYTILSNPNDGKWYILLNDFIIFISSDEQINY